MTDVDARAAGQPPAEGTEGDPALVAATRFGRPESVRPPGLDDRRDLRRAAGARAMVAPGHHIQSFGALRTLVVQGGCVRQLLHRRRWLRQTDRVPTA